MCQYGAIVVCTTHQCGVEWGEWPRIPLDKILLISSFQRELSTKAFSQSSPTQKVTPSPSNLCFCFTWGRQLNFCATERIPNRSECQAESAGG